MNFISKWKDKATEFIDIRVQLLKLNVVDKASSVLGYIMLSFIMLFMTLAVLIFLGISLQETFISFVDSRIAGSFMTFGFFVLLLLIIFIARKAIVNAFAAIFIRIMTDPGDDDDEDLQKEAKRYRQEMGLDDEDEEDEEKDQLRGKKVTVS